MKTYKFKVNNKEYEVAVGDADGKNVKVTVNGTDYDVELPEAPKAKPVIAKPATATAAPAATPKSAPAPAGAVGSLKSPLPGTVLAVNVTVGQAVKASDCVLVLEAMKMENNINAGKDGTVKAIYVNKGDNVLEAADLMLIE